MHKSILDWIHLMNTMCRQNCDSCQIAQIDFVGLFTKTIPDLGINSKRQKEAL